jgi:hypothetical protein
MKRILFPTLLLVLGFTASAQSKPNEDSVITRMKDDVCAELAKVPASDFTADNFQMKLGVQMIGVFQKYNDELTALYGDDYMTDQAKAYEIGKKIGMQLGMSCKAFQEILMKNPELVSAAMGKSEAKQSKIVKEEPVPEAPKEVKSFDGKVIAFTPGEVSYYTIKNGNEQIKLYWIGRFENDDELIANPKKIIGKFSGFGYVDTKMFNSVTKTYKTVFVITSYRN